MAPAASPESQLRRPPLNGAVIALFLAKSKPPNTSIRGKPNSLPHPARAALMESSAYIDNIRNYMRDGQRPETTEDGRPYFDEVGSLRAKLKKAQEVENELRARILELEVMLEARTGASSRTTQRAVVSKSGKTRSGSTVATKKRKRGGAYLADTVDGRATKLAKTTESSEGLHVNTLLGLLDIDLDLDDERHVNRLFDHMYRIRSAINSGGNRFIDAEELKHLVIQSATDIAHVIASVQTFTVIHAEEQPRPRRPTLQTQEDGANLEGTQLIADTDTKCVVVARFFPSLLKALARLPVAQNYQGEAIYSLTSIFKCLLERICSLSAFKSHRDLLTGVPRKKTGNTRGRLLAEISDYLPEPVHGSFSTGEKDDRVIKKLCQLAFSMIDCLDPNDSTEKELFESFLYFLLTRAGELLKEFMFNHKALFISRDTQGNDRRAEHEAQAPYIIYLLKHATTVTAKQFGLDTDFRKACNSISISKEENQSGGSILSKARENLQKTMLKAMYDEQADEFAESLKKPLETCAISCLDSGPSQIDGKMQTTSEWFKNEVWQTVGWDVLYDTIQFK